jgi:uncharacterized protein GlcG (DUF336 family)
MQRRCNLPYRFPQSPNFPSVISRITNHIHHTDQLLPHPDIAVVDSACHLIAFQRMEGAKITSINIAIDKAFTAAGHRAPTSIYKEAVWPGGPAFGIWNTNNNRFTTIAGGVPILQDGVVIGAIGCSTGLPAQDEDVALRGVEAVSRELRPKAKL